VNKSTTIKWIRYEVHVTEIKNAYKILARKRKGKRPLRRPRRIWEDSIKMDLYVWYGVRVLNWFMWLRIGWSSGLSWTR